MFLYSVRSYLFLTLFVMACFGQCFAESDIDRIYVVVNDEAITASEIEKELQLAIYELRSQGAEIPVLSQLKREVVDNVVLQKLQYQKARNLGLKISDDEVTLAVKGIAKRNELSILRLREAIEKTGISYDEYRQQLVRLLLIINLIDQEIGRYV